MVENTIIGIIAVVVGLLLFILIAWAVGSGFSLSDTTVERMLFHRIVSVWQALADKYHLTCLPGSSMTETHLFGPYRDCRLNLTLNQESTNGAIQKFTTLKLSTENKAGRPPAVVNRAKSYFVSSNLPVTLKGQIEVRPDQMALSYRQLGAEYDRLYLQGLFEVMYTLLTAYPFLSEPEDDFVAILQTVAHHKGLPLQPLAEQLLQNINPAPRQKAEPFSLVCSTCLAYYQHQGQSVSSFDLNLERQVSCRICRAQNGYFIGKVIAVLDQSMSPAIAQEDHTLQVNWLLYRQLFDFDEIVIQQAGDEEVERFAVQVGNDTDPLRKPRYKKIPCTISASCDLSDNTKRILQRMFTAG